MADTCTHLDTVTEVTPTSDGCEDCLRIGSQWVHLRMCMRCGLMGSQAGPTSCGVSKRCDR